MPSGAVIVQEDEIANENKRTVIYARVSSNDKKEDLKRQAERIRNFCQVNGWAVDEEQLEIASGLNDHRKKLLKLIKSKPGRIVVEHKDRLTRFGFNYFHEILPLLGIELVVINRDIEEENDLIKDLVAIITSFCCRLYGARRGQNKASKIKQIVKESNEKV
jgi:predicted site-specific integrase-resolvase